MEANFQKIYRRVVVLAGIFLFQISVISAQVAITDNEFQFFSTDKFSFEFKNDHSVKKFEDIWYVQQNATKNTSFVLFEKSGKVFNENLFECGSFFDRTEYCYSKAGYESVIKNLVIIMIMY